MAKHQEEGVNLNRDDQRDGNMGNNSASHSRTATDSAWSCEPMRDTHEFIREVSGRQYNAQNTIYFLPAGESSNVPAYSLPFLSSSSTGLLVTHEVQFFLPITNR